MGRAGFMKLARRTALLLCVAIGAGCAERETAQRSEPHPDGHIQPVYVATTRALDHTGPAFGFAVFPPVPTTNKHVVLDPERLWFTLKDGKIDKIEVIALGNLTGPAGLYLSIGGKMDMPPPSP